MDRHLARRAALVLVAVWCALLGGIAHAQEGRRGAAAEHRRGVQAFAEGRYAEAIESFRRADALRPSPAISYNVARAYERMGDSQAAIQEYREYLRRAPSARDAEKVERRLRELEQQVQQQRQAEQQLREQRQREVERAEEQRLAREMRRAEEERRAELAARPSQQQPTVRSTPAGASVSIDGRAVGLTPYAGALPPGPPADYAIRDEGEGQGIGTAGVLGWIAAGSAAAALGGALTFELLRQAEEERAKKAVTQIGFHERMETMQTQQTAARVLAGVGGGLAVVATVLLIAEASGASHASDGEGLSAQLMLGPRGTGAKVWARF